MFSLWVLTFEDETAFFKLQDELNAVMEERSRFHCVVSQQFWLCHNCLLLCDLIFFLSPVVFVLAQLSSAAVHLFDLRFFIFSHVYIWKLLLFKRVFEFLKADQRGCCWEEFCSKCCRSESPEQQYITPAMCSFFTFIYTCHDTGTNSTACQELLC